MPDKRATETEAKNTTKATAKTSSGGVNPLLLFMLFIGNLPRRYQPGFPAQELTMTGARRKRRKEELP
jgi:hypothetical protein